MITDGLWPGGYRAYAAKIALASTVAHPWERSYEERRTLSHEERVVRQVSIESAWSGTLVEGVWLSLRAFAPPGDNYQMDRAKFSLFARSVGVTSSRLREGIADVFFHGLAVHNIHGALGCISGLHVCKAIEVCFDDEVFRDILARHCFSSFTRAVCGEPRMCLTLDEAKASLQRVTARSNVDGGEFEDGNAELIKALEMTLRIMGELNVNELDLPSFASALFSAQSPGLAMPFTKHTLEVCARQLKPPFGTFPALPLQWLNWADNVPYNQRLPGDSDSLLLQQLEQGGGLRRRLHATGVETTSRKGTSKPNTAAKSKR